MWKGEEEMGPEETALLLLLLLLPVSSGPYHIIHQVEMEVVMMEWGE